LQAKVDELSRTSNDMKNLLDSTDIATLFLDMELCVRRFTGQAVG
jgi:two-component system CheB/CheR fusion protein